MALDVVMPKWGLTMKSGKIARWLVEEGAQISAGMPLLEVETDKITNVVEAPADGVLLEMRRLPARSGPCRRQDVLPGSLALISPL